MTKKTRVIAFIFHNFTLFQKMTNGGEKALQNGLMSEKLSPCLKDIISPVFLQI